MMKRLLSASAPLVFIMLSACGGGKTVDSDTDASDSAALFDSLAATELADSLAAKDSLASVDSASFAKVMESGNLREMLEAYNHRCLAVYDEYGSDGYPLGDRPQALEEAMRLRAALLKAEGRMNLDQKALFDSLTGYIRRFL